MSDPASGPPRKKPKTAIGAAGKGTNAFDVLLPSAKLCWPSPRSHPAFSAVLEVVAENGWFPWHVDDESGQNPDYSNLRLVSRSVKATMDAPKCGGPNFRTIARFLHGKNGFNDDGEAGFCDHCYNHHGEGCETCVDEYERCECKEAHRYGPALLELDPRLNPEVKFRSLPHRERATSLLRFLRRVASNFHRAYYKKWSDLLSENPELDEFILMDEDSPDLTMIHHSMCFGDDVFLNDFEQHNRPIFNFIHHLLFTGWAENDCYRPPGSCSPYRGELLGDGNDYNDWNYGHREWFHDMFQCFMRLHKSEEEETVPPPGMLNPRIPTEIYTLSQIRYLPETIRRCVANTIDDEARSLLGRSIADSIDIYRLVRETYDDNTDFLSQIEWMPCLGVSEEEYVPLDHFEGYNPQHERDNIDCTGLLWGEPF
ncbi:hypothetical protein ACHAWF_003254 [Thalassiosira exigua]